MMPYFTDSRISQLIGSNDPQKIMTARTALDQIAAHAMTWDKQHQLAFLAMLAQPETPSPAQNQPLPMSSPTPGDESSFSEFQAPKGYEVDEESGKLYSEAVALCRELRWNPKDSKQFFEAVQMIERKRG